MLSHTNNNLRSYKYMVLRQSEDFVFFVNDHVVSSIVVTIEPKIVYKIGHIV